MESKKKPVTSAQRLNSIKELEKYIAEAQQFKLSLDKKLQTTNEAEAEFNKVQIWENEVDTLSNELKTDLNEFWSICRQVEIAESKESKALAAEHQKLKDKPEMYLQELGLCSQGGDLESVEEGEVFSSSDEEEAEATNAGTVINSLKGTEYSSKCLEDASRLLANCGAAQQQDNMKDVTCGPLKLKSGYDCVFKFKDPYGKKVTQRGIGDTAVLAYDDARERLHKFFATKEKENPVEEG